MSAKSLRFCVFAATAFAVLSGCASVAVDGEAKKEGTQTETAPGPNQKPNKESAPGAAGLLGSVLNRAKPNADAVTGRIFTGAYAVELGAADRRRAREATHAALEFLPVGQLKVWRNPDNGHWGTVTATRTYEDAAGSRCREYRQTVTIGGDENKDTGAACRDADGVWRLEDA